MSRTVTAFFLLLCISAHAQLVVTVSPPKIVAQKAVVRLNLKNDLASKVESARAVCFLMDEQGTMVGQTTKWVIGQNKMGLEPKSGTDFNFVITTTKPFATTNLTAKVSFSRVVLDGGKPADIAKDVRIESK